MPSLDFEFEKQVFCDFYNENQGLLDGAKNSFVSLIESLLINSSEIAFSKIEGRVKNRDECIKKFTRKYRSKLESDGNPYQIIDHITDLIGIRVVCLYEDDIVKVKELLCEHLQVVDITDKISQLEKTENSFGYKGLHLDLRLDKQRKELPEYLKIGIYPVEIQIRTIIQDSWSVLDHKIKYKKSIPNGLKRRINSLAALFEVADREFKEIRIATEESIQEEEVPDEQISNESENCGEGTLPPRFTSAVLNAFSFLKIAKHFFKEYDFEPHKVDGFTEEIVSSKPEMTRGKFNYYMRENISQIKEYKRYYERENSPSILNPFTMIRHCLYLGDKEVFRTMLTNDARSEFDSWLERKA